MNQGKIWRVVNPTIGVPIFLGAVVVTSLFVHYQVLHNTTWVPGFLQGGAKAKAAAKAEMPSTPVAMASTQAKP